MKQQRQIYNPFFKRFKNVDGPGGMTLHCWPFLDLTLTWRTDAEYRWGPWVVEALPITISVLVGSLLAIVVLLCAV